MTLTIWLPYLTMAFSVMGLADSLFEECCRALFRLCMMSNGLSMYTSDEAENGHDAPVLSFSKASLLLVTQELSAVAGAAEIERA